MRRLTAIGWSLLPAMVEAACVFPMVSRQAVVRTSSAWLVGNTLLVGRAGAVDVADQLEAGLATLDELLANWDEATLNCNYAQVNGEILSSKAELLQEAKKNALMSKEGASIRRLCKRDPERVRLVLGLDTSLKAKTGVPSAFAKPGLYQSLEEARQSKSALVGADRLIRRGLDQVSEGLEEYVAAEEAWLEAIAAIDAASYASGAADLGAIVAAGDEGDAVFLAEARRSAAQARDALRTIVAILRKSKA